MWRMTPSSLIPELVIKPLGFSKDNRIETTSSVKYALHTVGWAAVKSGDCRVALGYCCRTHGMEIDTGIHDPPHTYPEAS